MDEQNHIVGNDLSEKMEKLGFLTLESNGEEIYLLTASHYFLVVESRFVFERNQLVYDFCRYTYNRRKKQTELQRVFFQNVSEHYMVKKVAGWLTYMLEKDYLQARNQWELLENARSLSGRKKG